MKYEYGSAEYIESKNEIDRLIVRAQEAILGAQEIADETGINFSINLGGYGMGGTYYSRNSPDYEWNSNYYYNDDLNEGFWRASSESC